MRGRSLLRLAAAAGVAAALVAATASVANAETQRALAIDEIPTGASVTVGEAKRIGRVIAGGIAAKQIGYSLAGPGGFAVDDRSGVIGYDGSAVAGQVVTLVVTAYDRTGAAGSDAAEITVAVQRRVEPQPPPSRRAAPPRPGRPDEPPEPPKQPEPPRAAPSQPGEPDEPPEPPQQPEQPDPPPTIEEPPPPPEPPPEREPEPEPNQPQHNHPHPWAKNPWREGDEGKSISERLKSRDGNYWYVNGQIVRYQAEAFCTVSETWVPPPATDPNDPDYDEDNPHGKFTNVVRSGEICDPTKFYASQHDAPGK